MLAASIASLIQHDVIQDTMLVVLTVSTVINTLYIKHLLAKTNRQTSRPEVMSRHD
jgi:hypothetical protein